jgi:hypothetical protein
MTGDKPAAKQALLPRPTAAAVASWTLFAAYAAVILLFGSRHVPWADEVQGWMRAASLASFRDFFVIPGGEGHPPLWYWLLRLLSFVMDLDHACWLSPLLALAAGAMVVSAWQKFPLAVFAVLFSAPFLWWPELFRPYELGAVLALGAALCLRCGHLKTCGVLLSLACFTHFYCFFVLPLFIGEEFLQRRGFTILKIVLLPCTLAFVLIVLSAQGNHAADVKDLSNLARFIKYLVAGFSLYRIVPAVTVPWMAAAAAVPLAGVTAVFGRNLYAAGVAACLLALSVFFALVYCRSSTHTFMLPFIVMLGALIRHPQANLWALAALLLCSDVVGVSMAHTNMTKPLSNSEAAYAYIEKAGLQHLKILAVGDNLLTPAAYRHHFRYWSLSTGREIDGLADYDGTQALAQYAKTYAAAGSPRDFLLAAPHAWRPPLDALDPLSPRQTCDGMKWHCRLLHGDDGAYFENVDIYRVTADGTSRKK